MRGTFRGQERARLRAEWAEKIVPRLAKREIAPLLRFYPLKAGLTVMDIGANKGLWTRALLNEFGARVGRVFMFDPSPENFRELTSREDNLAGLTDADFRRVQAFPTAMGRAPGSAILYTNEDGSPLGSLYPHQEPGWGSAMKDIRLNEQIEVRVDTVDGFLTEHGVQHVDIMKIDTEGHEMDVLLGADGAIRDGRIEVITFEFGVHQVESRHFFKDYWLHLTERGYEMYFVSEDGQLSALERYEYRWEQFDRNYDFIASRRPLRAPPAQPASTVASTTTAGSPGAAGNVSE